MEEELVAGESPDKSVDEGTPGAASTSAERDPRLSVFRPRDPEGAGVSADVDVDVDADAEPDGSGGRDALRDAVAAWVATAEEPAEPAERAEPAEPSKDSASADAAEPGLAKDAGADSAPAEPKAAPAEKAAVAPAADSASAQEPSVDSERTAVFRAVKPAAAASADKPVADERTTAFRAVKPAEPKDAPAEKAAVAPAADSASAQEPPVDSERTAVFRAVKPAAAERPSDSASADKPVAADDRTAAFRAVKPAAPKDAPAEKPAESKDAPAEKAAAAPAADSVSADKPVADERTTAFRAVKPAEPKDAPAGPAADSASADEPADSERTAVFRAVKPTAPEDAPVKEPAPRERTGVFRIPAVDSDADATDSERTAVFRAVKPPTAAERPADSASAQAAQPAPPAPPKASTFVPLRTDTPEQQPKPAAAATAPAPASLDRSERTTQQPLPPKPPLDMLADLTNNPPPPPSPLRTAVRRFKIYFPLAVLLAIILAVVQLVRPLPEPKLVMTAQSSYTFGGDKPQLPWPTEGQAYMAAAGLGTLGQSGEQKPVPIASVTKSMTAYIILRDHPIKKGEQGQMIDVDKTAETEGKKNNSTDNESTLDTVKEGEKISEYDAIAALMIPSANNIARLLARWNSGSQEAFVKKMNDTAKELGMTNTTYTDPSGLDATTVSTAEDQVKLGLKLVEIETLLDITKKPSWVDPSGKKWDNWNRLVPYNDSLGIKTGTTTKAGGNLLFAAQKKIGNTNQLIVGAVLAQHKPPIIDSVISASKQLMIATQKALEGAPVVKKGAVVGYVDDGLGGRTPVVATADVQAVGWASLNVNVKLAGGGGKIPQTAKAGTEIGVLTVGEGASQVKVPVALQSELAAPGIGSKLTRVG
ncbi:hypothetical protein [Streptomyces sp. NBC_00162]|uniref:hypothetical protein n=1 Tax=Streptomyces sp. NBC_00162 TaxID=2903629 RepID=UPI00214BA90D|nr:hypothetical protein [Streptomyces sp. NBC_00162]UUU44666.1 hypothetical protein JIW86_23640 [Streptomyces sp. NBC_00162]